MLQLCKGQGWLPSTIMDELRTLLNTDEVEDHPYSGLVLVMCRTYRKTPMQLAGETWHEMLEDYEMLVSEANRKRAKNG